MLISSFKMTLLGIPIFLENKNKSICIEPVKAIPNRINTPLILSSIEAKQYIKAINTAKATYALDLINFENSRMQINPNIAVSVTNDSLEYNTEPTKRIT